MSKLIILTNLQHPAQKTKIRNSSNSLIFTSPIMYGIALFKSFNELIRYNTNQNNRFSHKYFIIQQNSYPSNLLQYQINKKLEKTQKNKQNQKIMSYQDKQCNILQVYRIFIYFTNFLINILSIKSTIIYRFDIILIKSSIIVMNSEEYMNERSNTVDIESEEQKDKRLPTMQLTLTNQLSSLQGNSTDSEQSDSNGSMVSDYLDLHQPEKKQCEKILSINMCQYFSRLHNTKKNGQSTYEDPQFFNTYIRSLNHRQRKQKPEENKPIQLKINHQKLNLLKPTIAESYLEPKTSAISPQLAIHTGLIKSPQLKRIKMKSMEEENQIQQKNQQKQKQEQKRQSENPVSRHPIKTKSRLYDLYLQFFIQRCQVINQKLKEIKLTKIWRQYPCVIVYPKIEGYLNTSKNQVCQIFMGIFVALSIIKAQSQRMPFQVVIRSSFGHFLPSIAQIDQVFRLSPGVVPQEYLEKVIVPALRQTQQWIDKILQSQIYNNSTLIFQHIIQKSKNIRYKDFLKEKKQNKQFEFQNLFKQNYDLDYFVNEIILEHVKHKRGFQQSIKISINNLIQKLIKQKQQQNSGRDPINYKKYFQDFLKIKIDFSQTLIKDQKYFKLMEQIFQILKIYQDKQKKTKYNIKEHVPELHNLIQFAIKNKFFQILHDRKQKGESNNLSSKISTIFVSHRKVIVSSGMASITLSILASGHFIFQYLKNNNPQQQISDRPISMTQSINNPQILLKNTKPIKINTIHMYYEAEYFLNVFHNYTPSEKDSDIVLCDLNKFSIDINQNDNQKKFQFLLNQIIENHPNVKSLIIDITSIQSQGVSRILESLKRNIQKNNLPNLLTLMTVSSALKFNQLGSDFAPWGQIRIISLDKNNEKFIKTWVVQKKINEIIDKYFSEQYRASKQIQIIRRLFKKLKFTFCGQQKIGKIVKNNSNQLQIIKQYQDLRRAAT